MILNGTTFMPYVCCGDPDAGFTIKLVKILVRGGAGAIELGIPFSDPIADGKTIQAASIRALSHGMTPMKALEVLRRIRAEGVAVPVMIMTYYNILIANPGFLHQAKGAGADGIIVPDLPLEESEGLQQECRKESLLLIRLVSLNSSDARMEAIAAKAEGFIYAVATLGTTGSRDGVDPESLTMLKRAIAITKLPVAMGFGISKPEHAAMYSAAGASGVIVGSAIVEIYSKHITDRGFDERKALGELEDFSRRMKKGCETRI